MKITPDETNSQTPIIPAIRNRAPRDLTGKRSGFLYILTKSGYDKSGKNIEWLCWCQRCNSVCSVMASALDRQMTKSCKCLQKDVRGKTSIKHGQTVEGKASPEYTAWINMKKRCFNPNDKTYSYYGGRGITVHKNWINSFEIFYKDLGPKPEPKDLYSLERVNVNGNYEPTNCRWATKEEQMANRRSHCGKCGTEMVCPCCQKDVL